MGLNISEKFSSWTYTSNQSKNKNKNQVHVATKRVYGLNSIAIFNRLPENICFSITLKHSTGIYDNCDTCISIVVKNYETRPPPPKKKKSINTLYSKHLT